MVEDLLLDEFEKVLGIHGRRHVRVVVHFDDRTVVDSGELVWERMRKATNRGKAI